MTAGVTPSSPVRPETSSFRAATTVGCSLQGDVFERTDVRSLRRCVGHAIVAQPESVAVFGERGEREGE